MTGINEQLMACVALGKAVTETLDRRRILEVILTRLSNLVTARNWLQRIPGSIAASTGSRAS
jgi:hypothetical protein